MANSNPLQTVSDLTHPSRQGCRGCTVSGEGGWYLKNNGHCPHHSHWALSPMRPDTMSLSICCSTPVPGPSEHQVQTSGMTQWPYKTSQVGSLPHLTRSILSPSCQPGLVIPGSLHSLSTCWSTCSVLHSRQEVAARVRSRTAPQ